MTDQFKESEYKQAFEAGANQTAMTEYADTPVYIIPNNMKLASPDVRELETIKELRQERPNKLKQSVTLLSAESFIEYYNRYALEESTIFVNPESGSFTAVFDYHKDKESPAWLHHKAFYNCPTTNEWQAWIAHDNEKMGQEEFALFIEDNQREIFEPNGAEMLEIAASLKATKGVDFKSNIRLDNGEIQFNYTENIESRAGISGQFTIPEKIKLIVRPFISGHPYDMEARFRYRVNPNGLQLWYTLIRPHIVKQDAVALVIDQVKEKMRTGQILEAKAP